MANAMRMSAASTMGEPALGAALISLRRPCAQQRAIVRHWFKNNGECQLQRLAALAIRSGQMRVAAIGVRRANGPPDRLLILLTLDRAVEAGQDLIGVFALPAGPIMEHHARRRGAVPAVRHWA